MATLAEVATPARGAAPPAELVDAGDDDVEEVFFKGRAMAVPGAAPDGKENAGNSPKCSSAAKKRPRPLEHVLAAKSLASAGSPALAEAPKDATRRPRDSWVFADIVETPLAGSPMLSSKASMLGAVVGGKAAFSASTREKPRESILAFSDMSPLAATPTSEAGIFGSTFQSRGLFGAQCCSTVTDPAQAEQHDSNSMANDQDQADNATSAPWTSTEADAVSSKSDQSEQTEHTGEEPDLEDLKVQQGAKGKKRKDSILWFNDLSRQGQQASALQPRRILRVLSVAKTPQHPDACSPGLGQEPGEHVERWRQKLCSMFSVLHHRLTR